jgi:hypothetical protein
VSKKKTNAQGHRHCCGWRGHPPFPPRRQPPRPPALPTPCTKRANTAPGPSRRGCGRNARGCHARPFLGGTIAGPTASPPRQPSSQRLGARGSQCLSGVSGPALPPRPAARAQSKSSIAHTERLAMALPSLSRGRGPCRRPCPRHTPHTYAGNKKKTHRLPALCSCHRARHGSWDRRGHAHARVRGASRRAPSKQIQHTSEPWGEGRGRRCGAAFVP